MKFSKSETELLRAIQKDVSLSLAELASRCGMAQSTVWRKLQEFDANGLINGRVALINPKKAGCGLTVMTAIKLRDHKPDTGQAFESLVGECPEIVECLAVSGNSDYLLKVRVQDVESYESFLNSSLLCNPILRDVQSSFVLKEMKSTTEIPIA